MTELEAYHELLAYTATHGDATFIHQHVVDAYAAQAAIDSTKPIALTFALVGLYLHIELQFSGKQVQRAHMYLANRRRGWPSFPLPDERGAICATDVFAQPPGSARDAAIHAWAAAVWAAFCPVAEEVAALWAAEGAGFEAGRF